ncbi:MAG: hypothetical protein ACLUA4_05270 [Bifidobacterium sp.]
MKVSYSLNGQPLDSERMRVLVGTTHYTALSPIVDTVQVPGRHGVIVGSSIPVLDAPELTVKVAAWGADSDSSDRAFPCHVPVCREAHARQNGDNGERLFAQHGHSRRVHVLRAGR